MLLLFEKGYTENMEFGMILYIVIIVMTALLMIGIGIFQYGGKKPAQISTGAPPIRPEELTDVRAWNHCHGIMWIVYGVIMLAGLGLSFTFKKPLHSGMAVLAAVCLPIPFIPVFHNYLKKKYMKK